MHSLGDARRWPEAGPLLQFIMNNTAVTIGHNPNEVDRRFALVDIPGLIVG